MRAFFVTGTDTGVGKTTVSAALLAAASARGLRTACMKPAESGCPRPEQGELMPADARALLAAANMGQSLDEACPYRFEEPVAPGVAAQRTGVVIELARIQRAFEAIRGKQPDWLLVEGAGGLLVPLGKGQMVLDLIQALGLPLLIVARPGLGTINHTLLTISAARASGLEVAGVIFSSQHPEQDQAAVASNAREIVQASQVRYLGCLPCVTGQDLAGQARAAEAHLDMDALLSDSR